MSLSLTITLIVLADVALLAGLAYVMSFAARLTPHAQGVRVQTQAPTAAGIAPAARRRPTRPRVSRSPLASRA